MQTKYSFHANTNFQAFELISDKNPQRKLYKIEVSEIPIGFSFICCGLTLTLRVYSNFVQLNEFFQRFRYLIFIWNVVFDN